MGEHPISFRVLKAPVPDQPPAELQEWLVEVEQRGRRDWRLHPYAFLTHPERQHLLTTFSSWKATWAVHASGGSTHHLNAAAALTGQNPVEVVEVGGYRTHTEQLVAAASERRWWAVATSEGGVWMEPGQVVEAELVNTNELQLWAGATGPTSRVGVWREWTWRDNGSMLDITTNNENHRVVGQALSEVMARWPDMGTSRVVKTTGMHAMALYVKGLTHVGAYAAQLKQPVEVWT